MLLHVAFVPSQFFILVSVEVSTVGGIVQGTVGSCMPGDPRASQVLDAAPCTLREGIEDSVDLEIGVMGCIRHFLLGVWQCLWLDRECSRGRLNGGVCCRGNAFAFIVFFKLINIIGFFGFCRQLREVFALVLGC